MSLGYERYINKVIIIIIIIIIIIMMLLLEIVFVIGSHMPSSAHASHQGLFVLKQRGLLSDWLIGFLVLSLLTAR